MSKQTEPAAFGFRVKSGWATAILLAGPQPAPRVLERHIAELSDPAVPQSRQPYHAVMNASGPEAARLEERLCKVVQEAAQRSLERLQEVACRAGCEIRHAGLVVGSIADPALIHNDHIRAHAREGRLFRTALEEAARALGWHCLVLVERSAYTQGAEVLGESEGSLKRKVAGWGRSLSGPWRSEEKLAALAAWTALVYGYSLRAEALPRSMGDS